jgi:lysozyme family protein
MFSIIAVVTPEKLEEAKQKYRRILTNEILLDSVRSQTSAVPFTVQNIRQYDVEDSFGITYETTQLVDGTTIENKTARTYEYETFIIDEI